MPAHAEFGPVFERLRSLLLPFAPKLALVRDEPGHYHLDTYRVGKNKHPIMFAAVQVRKNYVSYYFMPIYAGAVKGMSPALRKRMQGKACFNFTQVDAELFAELADITKQGYESWRKLGWIE